jgi:2Fe-2S ferredoxin
VFVDEAYLPLLDPIEAGENEMLGNTLVKRQPNSRLSCQIQVTKSLDGMVVHTPEAQV